MNDEEKFKLAVDILTFGKQAATQLFPRPDRATAWAWAEILPLEAYPPMLWKAAVKWWVRNRAADRMATPRDLIAAARAAAEEWECSPTDKELLTNHREARLRQRIAKGELPEGTTPVRARDALPGGKTGGKPDLAAFRAEMRRRHALRVQENTKNKHDHDPLQRLQEMVDKYQPKETD